MSLLKGNSVGSKKEDKGNGGGNEKDGLWGGRGARKGVEVGSHWASRKKERKSRRQHTAQPATRTTHTPPVPGPRRILNILG